MKRIVYISIMILILGGTIALMAFADIEHTTRNYSSFHIEILNPSDTAMITPEDLKNQIKRNFGEIEGTPVLAIDIDKLEKSVKANPYISECEVYQMTDGALEMKVVLREPIVRIINEEGQQYYLDHFGYAMPINPGRPWRILIASGNITDKYVSLDHSEQPLSSFSDSSELRQIFPVAWFISRDNFLTSFIDQIYVNNKGELELVPKIGSQVIILGNAEDAGEKLENLRTFYQKIMNQIDWHEYKTINLKYKNQVVCSKYFNYE